MTRRAWARLAGEGLLSESVSYEIEATEHGNGEAFSVDITIDLGGLSLTIDFDPEMAEDLVVDLRDEIVRAKQKELAWQTDTDPETGVSAPEEDAP